MNTRAPSFAPVCRSSIAGRQVFLSAQVVQRKLTVALGLDRSRRFLAPEKNGTAAIRPGPQLIGPICVDQTTPAARVGSLASRGFWPANGRSLVQYGGTANSTALPPTRSRNGCAGNGLLFQLSLAHPICFDVSGAARSDDCHHHRQASDPQRHQRRLPWPLGPMPML